MSGTATTRPTKNVAKPMPMMATISNAQIASGRGLVKSARTLVRAATMVSVPRSSIIGTDTTLTANTMPANSAPTAK